MVCTGSVVESTRRIHNRRRSLRLFFLSSPQDVRLVRGFPASPLNRKLQCERSRSVWLVFTFWLDNSLSRHEYTSAPSSQRGRKPMDAPMSCCLNTTCQTGGTGDSEQDGYIDSLPMGLQDDGSKLISASLHPTPIKSMDAKRKALTGCESILITRHGENLMDDSMSCLYKPFTASGFYSGDPQGRKMIRIKTAVSLMTMWHVSLSKSMRSGIRAVWKLMTGSSTHLLTSIYYYRIDLYRSYMSIHTLNVLYPVKNSLTLSRNQDNSRNSNRNSKSNRSSNNSNSSTCSSGSSSSSSSSRSSRNSISRCRRSSL